MKCLPALASLTVIVLGTPAIAQAAAASSAPGGPSNPSTSGRTDRGSPPGHPHPATRRQGAAGAPARLAIAEFIPLDVWTAGTRVVGWPS